MQTFACRKKCVTSDAITFRYTKLDVQYRHNPAALPIQNVAAFICIAKQSKQSDGEAYSKAQQVKHGGSYTVHVVFPVYRFQRY